MIKETKCDPTVVIPGSKKYTAKDYISYFLCIPVIAWSIIEFINGWGYVKAL